MKNLQYKIKNTVPVSTKHVFASAVLADVGVLRALVDVVAAVGESGAVRAEFVELIRAGWWTSLTRRSPSHDVRKGHRAAATS